MSSSNWTQWVIANGGYECAVEEDWGAREG